MARKVVRSVASGEVSALPEGFEEVFGARVAGWFDRTAGNEIVGTLLEVFETKSKFSASGKKRVYKIEVTRGSTSILITPTGAPPEKGKTKVKPLAGSAGKGDIVGLDESGWLKRLASVELGREVYVKCLGKSEPSEEYPQGTWKYVVGVSKTGEVRRQGNA